jgi:hypothetical protein
MEKSYSLREAARLTGISEKGLRRSILMGELVAEEVADERQYMIAASSLPPSGKKNSFSPSQSVPTKKERVFSLAAFAVVAILSIGPLLFILWAGSVQRIDYFCAECTRTLHTVHLGQTVVLSHQIEPGPYTELVDRADPAPCSHEWISFQEGRFAWEQLEGLKKGSSYSTLEADEKVKWIRSILHQQPRGRPGPGERDDDSRFWLQPDTGSE